MKTCLRRKGSQRSEASQRSKQDEGKKSWFE
jgi:hypothetical protein